MSSTGAVSRNFLHRVREVRKLPPVLILWGDRDALIPIEQGRAFAALLDGAIFKTFAGSGHYLHNEQPEAFARAVREFLDDPGVPATRLRQPTKEIGNSPHELRTRSRLVED